MRYVLVLVLAAMTVPAAAEELKFAPDVISACLEAGGRRDCIGLAAHRCMEESEGGYSTPVTAWCFAAERDWWDAELNARYADLQARARVIDAQAPVEGLPPRPSDIDALRDMQRAWIAFRDTSCHYEELQWWGGTGASGTRIYCQMRLTGEQALTLRSYLNEG